MVTLPGPASGRLVWLDRPEWLVWLVCRVCPGELGPAVRLRLAWLVTMIGAVVEAARRLTFAAGICCAPAVCPEPGEAGATGALTIRPTPIQLVLPSPTAETKVLLAPPPPLPLLTVRLGPTVTGPLPVASIEPTNEADGGQHGLKKGHQYPAMLRQPFL